MNMIPKSRSLLREFDYGGRITWHLVVAAVSIAVSISAFQLTAQDVVNGAAEPKDDVDTVMAKLDSERDRSEGLSLAERLVDTSDISGDQRWLAILSRCVEIIRKRDWVEQRDSARLISKIVSKFPDTAEETLDRLVPMVADVCAVVKCELITALGMFPIRSQKACDALRREMNLEIPHGPFVASRAVGAIIRLTPQAKERAEMYQWLHDRLNHPKPEVRWMCAEVLGMFGKDAIAYLPNLRLLLHDPKESVVMSAARAIWLIAPDDDSLSQKICLTALRKPEEDINDRPISISSHAGRTSHTVAFQLLRQMGPSSTEAIDYLTEQLIVQEPEGKFSSKGFYRMLAGRALQNISPQAKISPEARKRLDAVSQTHPSEQTRNDAKTALERIAR